MPFRPNPALSTGPSGAAGGDLSGTYPNPGVAKIDGVTVSKQAGSPTGVTVPAQIGELNVNTTGGALYQAVGLTNTSWVQIGGSGTGADSGVNTTDNLRTQMHNADTGFPGIYVDPVPGYVDVFAGGSYFVQIGDSNDNPIVLVLSTGELGFFDAPNATVGAAVAQGTVTGVLSAVLDANVKTILTSLLAAIDDLTGVNLVINGTT